MCVSVVGGLAADHVAGLAFGGLRPHSPDEHVKDPNVLVVHSAEVKQPLKTIVVLIYHIFSVAL